MGYLPYLNLPFVCKMCAEIHLKNPNPIWAENFTYLEDPGNTNYIDHTNICSSVGKYTIYGYTWILWDMNWWGISSINSITWSLPVNAGTPGAWKVQNDLDICDETR